MKKTKNQTQDAVKIKHQNHPKVEEHFRCCHMCGHVTQAFFTSVDKCEQCNKSFPLLFFCNELKDLSDKSGTYPPLIGISLCWD